MIYSAVVSKKLVISETELSARLMTPPASFPDGLDKYISELTAVIKPAFSAVEVDVRKPSLAEAKNEIKAPAAPFGKESDTQIEIGGALCKSKALARILRGCKRAVLLCATLGFEAERYLRKACSSSPSEHFILDAAADAMAEALCDAAEAEIFGERPHAPRFSPGYADLPIEFVGEIIRLTDAEKLLGVRLTKTFLTVPVKTVTAIIGIKEEDK